MFARRGSTSAHWDQRTPCHTWWRQEGGVTTCIQWLNAYSIEVYKFNTWIRYTQQCMHVCNTWIIYTTCKYVRMYMHMYIHMYTGIHNMPADRLTTHLYIQCITLIHARVYVSSYSTPATTYIHTDKQTDMHTHTHNT